MIDLVIRGGRVLDPARDVDRVAHVLVDAGRVVDVVAPDDAPRARAAIDAAGLWVTPGLVDMHVHLREPGGEHKETIATGAAAAVAGGFTTVATMANTDPVNDDPEITRWMIARARAAGLARVLPIAAVTRGLAGETLTDFAALRAAGAVAFSDDGVPIMRADVMRAALAAGRGVGAPVIAHAEDRTLACGGVMHAGAASERLGLPGMPSAAESEMVRRDCALAAETGGHLHVAHLSTAAAVAIVRAARAAGMRVTAEATPHHVTLDAEAVAAHGTLAKMNPPLRAREDVAAVRAALADGTLDVIASDHAPHHADEKALGMAAAPFGIVGLETTLPLVLELVHGGVLAVATAIRALTIGPARALGIDAGTLAPGAAADVTLIDPEARWTIDPSSFRSRSRNTPFAGRAVRGRAVAVCLAGRVVGDHLGGRFTP
ncbi:MAG: dihydroorotase [Deltaproteobacteria bacterium]|nr:dihydroorotase [Deltaproteobacteria bacterium]